MFSSKNTVRGFLSTLALLALVGGLTACDATDTQTSEGAAALDASEQATPNVETLVGELTADLELTAAQAETARQLAERYQGRRHEPGVLWRVAADLQQSLDAEQKERLFARLERWQQRLHQGDKKKRRQRFAKHRRHRVHQGRARLLTDEQKEQAKALRKRVGKQMRVLMQQRKNGEITPAAFREQMKALREQLRTAMQDLLTDEQKEQLEQRREERKAEHEQAQAVRAEVLGLTAAQKEALQALREEQKTRREELAEQLREGDALREAFKTLHEAWREAAAEILAAEQQEIVKLHRALTLRRVMRHRRAAQAG